MNQWLVNFDGTQYAAESPDQIRLWLSEGRIPPHAHVYHPNLGNWVSVGDVSRVIQRKRAPAKEKSKWARALLVSTLGAIAILMLAAVVINVASSDRQKASRVLQPPSQRAVPATPKVDSWYEGGTLHESTVATWRAASPRNRLATCADFVANLETFTSMRDMRRAAEDMEKCISQASEGTASTQSTPELAAACAILMGYR